jgi:hypothetical protein
VYNDDFPLIDYRFGKTKSRIKTLVKIFGNY